MDAKNCGNFFIKAMDKRKKILYNRTTKTENRYERKSP